MLYAEADWHCGAGRYDRSQARQDIRAGSYERSLQTEANFPHFRGADRAL